MPIQEIHLVSHTHTDFGFTDYPDTLLRHHNRIIDRAIDTCEAESGREDRARFRWTCEVAAITANWFRTASTAQKDRFLCLHREGLMAAGGMAVHWTPLISPANAARSMRMVDFLRRECELDVRVAWQCDVNGLGWHWLDLLIDMGMDGFVLAPNPHRGMPFDTQQRVFNWQAPSGRSLFALHGWHYSVGAWGFFLGDDDMEKTQAAIDRMLANLEKRGGYELDTILCQVTNPAAIDNGFPTNISAFVERWNAEGRTPVLRLSTLDQALAAVKAKATNAPTWRGDWPDYWVDGVGSTSYETALARSAERHLPALELIGALRGKEAPLMASATDRLQFYDEHTWGAFCSVIQPDSPFTRSQLSWKTGRAYEGFALTQEALADQARSLARERTGQAIENDLPIRRGQPGPTPIEEQSYYVLNPTGVARRVRWPVTWDYGGAAPQTILHAYLSDEYLPGMKVDKQGFASSATHIIDVELPAFGEAVVKPVAVGPPGELGEGWIGCGGWRLEVDPKTGAIASLARDGRELVGGQPLGLLIYESLRHPEKSRASIFGESGDWQYDWSRLETIAWPRTAPEFVRRPAETVAIGETRRTLFGPEIDVHLAWSHGDTAVVTYRLPDDGAVEMRIAVDKMAVEAPESLHVLFGRGSGEADFRFDVGDHVITPAEDQIPESCRAWYALQGFAGLETAEGALVVASPDAPLVQPGGIHTDHATDPQDRDPVLAFWLLNNHWDVNFAAAQGGRRLFYRFRLDFPKALDELGARAFAESAMTAPVIVRAYDAAPVAASPVLSIDDAAVIGRLRRAEKGEGLVLTLVNPTSEARRVSVGLRDADIAGAERISAVEELLGIAGEISDGNLSCQVPPGATQVYRLALG